MVSLFMLLDDITALLDDIALMTKMASKKAAGIVGDDLALNANQITEGKTPAERELAIVWAVAKGSLMNKFIITPIALLLSVFLPALITPLLMIGGAYLCFEGVEKVWHTIHHKKHDKETEVVESADNLDDKEKEKAKIKGAIRTDFILSAEIIIISLGVVQNSPLMTKIVTLSVIGIGLTVLVYGLVAVIVRADDVGLYLTKQSAQWKKKVGTGILLTMPYFMRGLAVLGTVAMFAVGGGIFAHQPDIHHVLESLVSKEVLSSVSFLVDIAVGTVVGIIAVLVFNSIMAIKNQFSAK